MLKVVMARMSSKGQVTVPKAIRDAMGLEKGTLVEFRLTEDGVQLRSHGRGFLDLVGSVKPRNRPEDWKQVREETMKAVARRAVERGRLVDDESDARL